MRVPPRIKCWLWLDRTVPRKGLVEGEKMPSSRVTGDDLDEWLRGSMDPDIV